MAISTLHVPVLFGICGRCGAAHSFDGSDITPIEDKRVHPEGKSHGIACPTCGGTHPITQWSPENPLVTKPTIPPSEPTPPA